MPDAPPPSFATHGLEFEPLDPKAGHFTVQGRCRISLSMCACHAYLWRCQREWASPLPPILLRLDRLPLVLELSYLPRTRQNTVRDACGAVTNIKMLPQTREFIVPGRTKKSSSSLPYPPVSQIYTIVMPRSIKTHTRANKYYSILQHAATRRTKPLYSPGSECRASRCYHFSPAS